jgi:hypothetical protein
MCVCVCVYYYLKQYDYFIVELMTAVTNSFVDI